MDWSQVLAVTQRPRPPFFIQGDGKAGGSMSPFINYEPATAMLALCSFYVVL